MQRKVSVGWGISEHFGQTKMGNLPARIALIIAGTIIALIGIGTAGAFVCIAIYGFLIRIMAPPYAALTVAAMVLVLTLLLLAVLVMAGRSGADEEETDPTSGLLGLQLGRMLSTDLLATISRNPYTALLVAALGGVVIGVSPRLREALLDLLRR